MYGGVSLAGEGVYRVGCGVDEAVLHVTEVQGQGDVRCDVGGRV